MNEISKNVPNTVSAERRAEIEELGRAKLKRISDFLLKGEPEPPTFLDEVRVLNHASVEERAIYERFLRVNSWVIGIRSEVFTRQSHLLHALGLIAGKVNDMIICEAFTGYQDDLPEILSWKDFVDARKKTVEKYLTKDGEDVQQSAFDLFIVAVEYWIEHLKKHQAPSNPLVQLQEQYQVEDVKSAFVLEKWNRVNKNGFYVLKSGIKSEIMTREEFDEFTIRETQFDLDDIIKNYFGSKSHTLERDLFHDRDSLDGIEWHVATGKPRTAVKKWQAVQVLGKLYNGEVGVEDMVNEFPGLIETISEQVKKDFKIDIASIPIKDWKKPFITRRKLYEMDFYLQRRKAETFYKDGVPTSVAVVQDKWDTQSHSKPDPVFYVESSLEGFSAAQMNVLDRAKESVADSYYFIKGFACAVEMLAEIHDLPGFRRLACPAGNIDRGIKGLRNNVETLYGMVRKLPASEKRLKKLQVLKDHLLFEEWEKTVIPRENIRKARRLVKNLEAFQPKRFVEFYSLILQRPKKDLHERQ